MSAEEARHARWLVHISASGAIFDAGSYQAFSRADWWLVLEQAGSIATVMLVSALALLLNSSAIELSVERDIDLDRELKINGIANILSGISGGTVGFTSVNIAEFVVRMGASGRLIGLVCASGSALVLYCGTEAINYIPEPLIGGFLLYIGLEFLTEWVIRPAREPPRADQLVIAIIFGDRQFCRLSSGHCRRNHSCDRALRHQIQRRRCRASDFFGHGASQQRRPFDRSQEPHRRQWRHDRSLAA
jgi:SulP family sulfate permease